MAVGSGSTGDIMPLPVFLPSRAQVRSIANRIDNFAINSLGRPTPEQRTENRDRMNAEALDAAIDAAPWLIGGGGWIKGGQMVRAGTTGIARQIGWKTWFTGMSTVKAKKYVDAARMVPHVEMISRGLAMQNRAKLWAALGIADFYAEQVGEDLI